MKPIICIPLLILAASALFLAGYTVFIEPRRFRIVRARMRISRAFEPALHILHVSDMHFKKGDEAKLQFLQSLKEPPADLVFVTGDMIENDSGIDYCVRALGEFKPRLGVFAVFGAHDHWDSRPLNVALDLSIGGYHQGPPNDFDRLKRKLEAAGVTCLQNESRRVALCNGARDEIPGESEVWLVGIDDKFIGLDDLDAALEGVPREGFRILLTHAVENPGKFAARGFDAVFAGHSHGGQVRFPFIGPIMTRSGLERKFASGVFEVAGTTFHINNGIGVGKWTPFRFMCPPEATFIELEGQLAGNSAEKSTDGDSEKRA